MQSGNKRKPLCAGPFDAILASLAKYNVEYILIGGQAVIAYGASQFTRDADFWVNPVVKNVDRLRNAIAELRAEPRFLPPLELSYLKKGHGIHFTFHYQGQKFHIDILGKPPRVSNFPASKRDAVIIDWNGLRVPVLDIRRLINTKKTDRERDYLVIQLLCEMVFEQERRGKRFNPEILRWLAAESRTPAHLRAIARLGAKEKNLLLRSKRPAAIRAGRGAPPDEIQKELDIEKENLKQANRLYWRPFLDELRRLRRRP